MKTETLLEIDHRSASGSMPSVLGNEPGAALEHLCWSLSNEPDARQAELLATLHPELALPAVRSHLLRGRLDEAEAKLSSLQGKLSQDPALEAEALYERARLEGLRGRWSECALLCDAAFARSPALITQLSLLQTRATAYFELGKFSESLNDVEMVLSQMDRYPSAVAVAFARIQQVKLLARLHSPCSARKRAERLWSEMLASKPLNLEHLLILLRLEIDFARIEGRPFSTLAAACYGVANLLGDRLYEGLAILDWASAYDAIPEFLGQALSKYAEEFERVRLLKEEVERPDAGKISTSAASIRGARVRESGASASPEQMLLFETNRLLIPRYRCLLDVRGRQAATFGLDADWLEAIATIGPSGIARCDLFKSIWGMARYNRSLHDGVLRTFLHRLRKNHGITLESRDQRVYLEGILVITA